MRQIVGVLFVWESVHNPETIGARGESGHGDCLEIVESPI